MQIAFVFTIGHAGVYAMEGRHRQRGVLFDIGQLQGVFQGIFIQHGLFAGLGLKGRYRKVLAQDGQFACFHIQSLPFNIHRQVVAVIAVYDDRRIGGNLMQRSRAVAGGCIGADRLVGEGDVGRYLAVLVFHLHEIADIDIAGFAVIFDIGVFVRHGYHAEAHVRGQNIQRGGIGQGLGAHAYGRAEKALDGLRILGRGVVIFHLHAVLHMDIAGFAVIGGGSITVVHRGELEHRTRRDVDNVGGVGPRLSAHPARIAKIAVKALRRVLCQGGGQQTAQQRGDA